MQKKGGKKNPLGYFVTTDGEQHQLQAFLAQDNLLVGCMLCCHINNLLDAPKVVKR
jgi:hypothetical protein